MKVLFHLLILVGTIAHGQRSDFYDTSFEKADSIALRFKGSSLKNLPALTHNLTANLSKDVEKFRAIYTWVCTNIENDYGAYQKTLKKRKKLAGNPEALSEWNDSYTPKVFEKLMGKQKTACTGYAFLIRELANLADINCKIINGYGRTATLILNDHSIPNHSWNAVELNGKWYLCDPTWSAGRIVLENEGARFEADYFDGYFLADPALFIMNHFPLKSDWALLQTDPSFQTFLQGPVVYKEAFRSSIRAVAPVQMHLETLKNKPLSFTLSSPNSITHENTVLVLQNGTSRKEVKPQLTRNQNRYRVHHKFEKTGNYDVHIKIDDAIIATYVVRVRKK